MHKALHYRPIDVVDTIMINDQFSTLAKYSTLPLFVPEKVGCKTEALFDSKWLDTDFTTGQIARQPGW